MLVWHTIACLECIDIYGCFLYLLGSEKKTCLCGFFTDAVLCNRGKILSMLNLSVALIPPARISAERRTSLSTRLRVSSRAEMYGWIGRSKISWFGLMPSRLMRSKIDLCSSLRGLRLPKAVMGSAMRLGRGTNGTFSQSTSRLWNFVFAFVQID